MAQVGQRVPRSDLRPGDMVFFSLSGGRISHVGMYVGEGRLSTHHQPAKASKLPH